MIELSEQGKDVKSFLQRYVKWKYIIIFLTLILLIVITFAIIIGPVNISAIDAYKIIIKNIPFIGGFVDCEATSIQEAIILQVRLPRVLAGAIVGIALSVAGVVLQGLLRNPMVDPYIMGISAGASLGASLVIAFGIGLSVFGVLYSLPIISFIFALGTVLLF